MNENIVLLDIKQVSQLLGCSPRHVHRLAETGILPAPIRLGVLVRWHKAAIHHWIETGATTLPLSTKGKPRKRFIA